jgi:hypothetical protein
MIPQAGMMVFDHNTNTLTNESYGQLGMAYWYGSLNYMPLGKGKGFLINLMGEMAPAGVPLPDLPDRGDEHGDEVSFILHLAPVFEHQKLMVWQVSFQYIMLYNLDTRQWVNQSAKSWDGEKPVSRSRFCGKTVYSRETNTWEYVCATLYLSKVDILTLLPIFRLWVYGGMLINPLGGPVQDVYVLTMPSFMYAPNV